MKTYHGHKNCIANKLYIICGIITRLKQYVPLYNILNIIYNSLFVSNIIYCITAWGGGGGGGI